MASQSIKQSSPKSNFLLLLSAITLIIIVSGLFFGKYFSYNLERSRRASVSPTPAQVSTVYTEDTRSANWKTYTNEAQGFLIKYPNTLETEIESAKCWDCQIDGNGGSGPQPNMIIQFISPEDKQTNRNQNLPFYKHLYRFSLSVYYKTTLQQLYGDKAPTGYEQNITDYLLGGKTGLRNVQKGDSAFDQTPYLLYGVENNGKTYSFMFPNRTGNTQDSQEIDQILSTFRFD